MIERLHMIAEPLVGNPYEGKTIDNVSGVQRAPTVEFFP